MQGESCLVLVVAPRAYCNILVAQREASATIDPSFKRQPLSAEQSDSHSWATLAVLECRGCEFVEFDPYQVRAYSNLCLALFEPCETVDLEVSREGKQHEVYRYRADGLVGL